MLPSLQEHKRLCHFSWERCFYNIYRLLDLDRLLTHHLVQTDLDFVFKRSNVSHNCICHCENLFWRTTLLLTNTCATTNNPFFFQEFLHKWVKTSNSKDEKVCEENTVEPLTEKPDFFSFRESVNLWLRGASSDFSCRRCHQHQQGLPRSHVLLQRGCF